MKPEFQPLDRDRKPTGAPVPYTPLIFIAGDRTHRLALHRDIASAMHPNKYREWVVSHPEVGAIVCRVRGTHKGMPVSSRGFTTAEARAAAMACLDAVCERIGSNAFNSKIDAELAR